MQKKTKKKQKWVRFRHRIIRNIAYVVLNPYVRLKYHIKIEPFKQQEKRPYLVLFNHQTALDQFIVGSSFKGPVYYVASEDLFSNGFISRLLEWAVAPIPIKKQATDARAVLNCMRVMKEGGTIALAPEGNRTFSGKTEYIKPAIVGLVKALKIPIVLYRIEGGYGVHPRWSDVARKGRMRSYVHKVLQPEDYFKMSDEELLALILKELHVDEGCMSGEFHHKRLAEYIERAYYVCPYCGLTEYQSDEDTFTCKKCSRMVRYLPTKELQGVGFTFPFRFTTQWYDYQSEFINGLNLSAYEEKAMYKDVAELSKVKLYDKKYPIDKEVKLSLYGNRIVAVTKDKTYEFPFDKVSTVTVLGRNKLNIYFDGEVYQLKGDKRFNAVKYVQICYRYKNIQKGEEDGKLRFLGL